VAILIGLYILWAALVVAAVLLLLFARLSAPWPVRVGGLCWMALIFSFYYFCEVFPDGRRPKNLPPRLIALGLISCAVVFYIFYADFVYDRRVLNGAPASRHGPAYFVLNGWAALMAVFGLLRLLYKRRRLKRSEDGRRYLRLIAAILASLALGLAFAVALPALDQTRYAFVGLAAPVFVILALIYGALFDRAFQVASFALGILLRASVAILTLVLLYGVFLILLETEAIRATIGGPIYLTLVLALFAAGIHLYLFPLLTRRLVWRTPPTAEMIQALLRQTGEGFDSQDRLQRELVVLLKDHLNLESVLLLAQNASGGFLVHGAGGLQPAILTRIRNPLGLIRPRRNVPIPDVVRYLDRIIDLEKIPAAYFPTDRLGKRYRRLAAFGNQVLHELKAAGYAVVLPLVFHRKVSGFLAIGPRLDGRAFLARDLNKLNALRLTAAVLIEHVTRFQQINELRNRAEADASRLAEVLGGPAVQKRSVKNKTLIYRTTEMHDVMQKVETARGGDQPVLITGETGTGKELIAQMIHTTEGAPFVAVNCGAVPESLWEDEIFGHVKGAFTDARADRKGRIAEAAGGTLFFDELGEMPLAMQVKLLRVLQEREYTPIGGSGSRPTDCRFVFATNRDLRESIAAGSFREDLYYRVNVFAIRLPALRERRPDIPVLAEHILTRLAEQFERPARKLELSALQAIVRHDWPGNVRELENVLLRSLLAGETGPILLKDLPLDNSIVRKTADRALASGFGPGDRAYVNLPLRGSMEDLVAVYEKRIIAAALEETSGNKTRAAILLEISRNTLRYKLKSLFEEIP
ncbi:MAG: sigma-54 dependent transcriptional regulator, partial [Leptospirales bacterium]